MALIETTGRHAVTVTDLEFGESNKGNPRITLYFKNEDGNTIAGDLYLDDSSKGKDDKTCFQRTDEVLKKVFGFDGDYPNAAAKLKGKPASIEVAEETYNGKTRCKVAFINAPRAEIGNQGSFLAQLAAKSKKLGAPAPAPAPAAKSPAKPTKPDVGDEDGPF